ncbi:MAG: nitroreductase family protein [Methanoregula sp.]|jgi:nitroreductase/NAD-dependent dihydropyrimidine dehydrogenase PreA subunit|nr:nitroreductase family protein [Methanoregula sp.]
MTINVDSDTCTRCGICSEVCPLSVIGPVDEETLPRVAEGRSGMCISCGHCEAFCPTGALTQSFADESQTGSQRETCGEISPDNLGIYLKSRRSIRKYRPEPVGKETIEALLDVARYAASGGNGQPVEWLVIRDPKEVQKVAGLTIEWMRELANSNHPMSGYVPHLIAAWERGSDIICRGAPHLLIPNIPEESPIAPTDAIIALTTVDIAAPAFGLGTCWAGFVAMASRSYRPLQDYYALPKGRIPAYAMMFGYPRHTPHLIPRRNPLKVTWR